MSIVLIRYVLKAYGSSPRAPKRRMYEISSKSYEKPMKIDQELQRGYMSIFLIRYASKAQGSRPGASRRIYEYTPY